MTRFLALLAVAAAVLATWPILGNYFYADDFDHLLELATFGPRDFILAPNAGHMYLVRNAVFYLSFLAFDMEPAGYFTGAVATHGLNALLLFAVIRRLTADALVAGLVAVLFAVSPENPGTLGWYSVYGHALATTATLIALLLVAPAPGVPRPLSRRSAAAAALAMLVASQCFGTGAAVAIVFPAVAFLLRPELLRTPRSAALLAALPLLVLLAWVVMNAIPSRLNPWGAQGARGLALLATDYRVVAFMTAHLLAIGIHTLVLGPAVPLTRYGSPLSIAAVVLFAAAVGGTLLTATRDTRRRMLALGLAAP